MSPPPLPATLQSLPHQELIPPILLTIITQWVLGTTPAKKTCT